MSRLLEEYKNNIVSNLKTKLELTNIYEVPKIQKIILNMGIGDGKDDSKLIDKGIVLVDAPPPAANYIPYVKTDKLIIISGQVKTTDINKKANLRQHGVQGADILSIVKNIIAKPTNVS